MEDQRQSLEAYVALNSWNQFFLSTMASGAIKILSSSSSNGSLGFGATLGPI
jgi:hypothetical protein